MKIRTIFPIILMLLSLNTLNAQDNSSLNTEVKVILTRSLSLQASKGLLMGDIFQNPEYEKLIKNGDGMKFSITGQSNRIVIISYDDYVTLAKANLIQNLPNLHSGSLMLKDKEAAVITFKTNTAEQTGAKGNYLNPKPFSNGSGISLVENSHVGKLNFWIGGSLILPKILKDGQYIGKFEVTSIY